jgi:hypothetical protein
MNGAIEVIGAVGALVAGVLLGMMTPPLKRPRKDAAPVPVPVPVEDQPQQARKPQK